jgi:hypothetical protein
MVKSQLFGKMIFTQIFANIKKIDLCIIEYRALIFKLLRSPRIDSKEAIPTSCGVWRAGMTNLFLLGS